MTEARLNFYRKKIDTSIPEFFPADVAESKKLRPDNEIGNAMA
jgi:hypothetical protein